MTKKQAALFAIGVTGVFTVVFLGLTVHSHIVFPRLTNEDQLTPQVLEGKDRWHEGNCVNCHTLMGEGAYYAPDLTQIALHRGDDYLMQFLEDPRRFYSEQEHRRLMPNPKLTETQRREMIAFLHWISQIENQNWPPRPILVSGSAIPGAVRGGRPAGAASSDPVAQGEALFHATPPGCFACHSTSPGVNLAGPTLASIATRAAAHIGSPGYRGAAQDAKQYIHESIVAPSAYVVPGQAFSANGRSFMPHNFTETLTAQQIDQLVAYLMSLH